MWGLAEDRISDGNDWNDVLDGYYRGDLPDFIKSDDGPISDLSEFMTILEIVAQYVDTPEDKRGSPEDYTHNFKLALPKYNLTDMTDLFLELDGSEPVWVDSLYAFWAHYIWRIDGYEYGAFAPYDAYQLIEWYIHERNWYQQHRSGKAASS